MWDDDWLIYENPALKGISLESFRLIFTNEMKSSSWYTPLTGLRWSITKKFFGLDPLGYHLGNLFFHILDAVLLFLLLRKLLFIKFTKSPKPGNKNQRITFAAAAGALIWALHPLRVEPVAGAAGGAYGQALLFLLVSLLMYLFANDEGISLRSRLVFLSLSVLSFLASLLCQPIGMGLVVLLLALDVSLLKRLGGDNGWWKTPAARKALFEKIPYFLVTLLLLAVTIAFFMKKTGIGHSSVSLAKFGVIDRTMQAMYVWAYYLWRPFYPIDLAPVYSTLVNFNPLSWPFIASSAAVLGVTLIALSFRRRWPTGLSVWICYLVLLIPNLGILEHPHYPVDRYSIVVSLCFSALLAGLLASTKINRNHYTFFASISIGVIMVLGFLTFKQALVWKNSVTLFEHTIKTLGDDPYRADIHYRLGSAYVNQGDIAKASTHFQETLKIMPLHPVALPNLSNLLESSGKFYEAILLYENALAISPEDIQLLTRLARAQYLLGQREQAIVTFKKALAIRPDLPEIYSNLGAALASQGKIDEAIHYLKKGIRRHPGNMMIRQTLNHLLTIQKRGSLPGKP